MWGQLTKSSGNINDDTSDNHKVKSNDRSLNLYTIGRQPMLPFMQSNKTEKENM